MSDIENLEIYSTKQLLDELIRREVITENYKKEIEDYSRLTLFSDESLCRNCRHDSIMETFAGTVLIDSKPWDIIKKICNNCNTSWKERRING